MFTLYNLETAEIVSRANFADGRAASRAARLLSVKTGRRYQPRRAPDANIDWQARERGRFETGEYMALCERLTQFAPEEHFAHIAKKRPELIAYTKDAQKGASDKQSLISVRAYIDLIAPEYFSDASKDALAREQLSYARGIASPLQFAGPGNDDATADAIERVYTRYAREIDALNISCMRKPANHYDGQIDGESIHPVRAYAGGDLAIAYIVNDDGLTVARALCWPEKKLYSRVYAADDAIHSLLRAMGYSKSRYFDHSAPSMAGARLARVELDCGSFLGPYLDEVQSVTDCGDCLKIDFDGELSATNIDGKIPVRPRIYCERCEDDCDEEDSRTVYRRANQSRSVTWCCHCADSYAEYCDGTDALYDPQNVDMTVVGGTSYTTDFVENNASFCEYLEEYTFGDTYTVIIDDDGNAQTWGQRAIVRHAFKFAGQWYSEEVENETIICRREWLAYRDRALCYVSNLSKRVPVYLNEDGSLFYEATDGNFYMRGCDNRTNIELPCEIKNDQSDAI